MEIIETKVFNIPQLIPYFIYPEIGHDLNLNITLTPYDSTPNSWVAENTELYMENNEGFYTPSFTITYNGKQYIAWHDPPSPFACKYVEFNPEFHAMMYSDE